MNRLPISPDSVIDRVVRASKELADALAAYRRLQARVDEVAAVSAQRGDRKDGR